MNSDINFSEVPGGLGRFASSLVEQLGPARKHSNATNRSQETVPQDELLTARV